MSDPIENDIDSEVLGTEDPEGLSESQKLAYEIAVFIMEEYKPGFVVIGSPNMAETPAGYQYPDSVGIVINNDIELTPFGLAAVLEELSRQLSMGVDEVEDYVRDQTNDSE